MRLNTLLHCTIQTRGKKINILHRKYRNIKTSSRYNFMSNKFHTVLSVRAILAQLTIGRMLNAFDEKRIIEVAKVKRDLRRDGGSGPAALVE